MLKLNQSKGGSKVPILGDLPFVGLAFRSSGHSDIQSKLYVFVRAEIIRPTEALANVRDDMKRISDLNRAAFEEHEEEFQNYQYVPGLKPEKMDPAKVLELTVFFLQALELFYLVELHLPVLLSPVVVCRIADFKLSACLFDGFTLGNNGISFPQFFDNLFRRVKFTFHLGIPFIKNR